MAEDGRVVFKITADSSQATQALNDFEETAQNTADSTEKSFSDSAKEIAASIGAAFSVKKFWSLAKPRLMLPLIWAKCKTLLIRRLEKKEPRKSMNGL